MLWAGGIRVVMGWRGLLTLSVDSVVSLRTRVAQGKLPGCIHLLFPIASRVGDGSCVAQLEKTGEKKRN